MVEDTEYNGYTNYPTWNISLWLYNDRVRQAHLRAMAQKTLSAFLAEDSRRNPHYNSYKRLSLLDQGTVQFRFADEVKEFVEEIGPDLGASFTADLVGWALSQVNWQEIAQKLLSELK